MGGINRWVGSALLEFLRLLWEKVEEGVSGKGLGVFQSIPLP